MSIQTALAEGEARERERQWRAHKTDCAICGRKRTRARDRRACRVGTALNAAAVTARVLARAEAIKDAAPAPGQLSLFDGAEWR